MKKKDFFPSKILQLVFYSIFLMSVAMLVTKLLQQPIFEVRIGVEMFLFASIGTSIIFLVTWLINYRNGYKYENFKVFNTKNFKSLIYWVPIAVLLFIGVVNPFYNLWNQKEITPINLSFFYVLNFVIVSPFCEEVIFRGLILNAVMKKYGEVKSIFIATLLFTLGHEPNNYFIAFIMGLMLGYVYIKTKNVFVVAILHMIVNFTSALVNNFILEEKMTSTMILSINIVSFIMLVGFVYFSKNKIFQKNIS